jgi:hypothetical protein
MRCFFGPWIPEWKKIWIRDKHPGFPEQLFGLKIVNFFVADPDLGSGKDILIWDKYP